MRSSLPRRLHILLRPETGEAVLVCRVLLHQGRVILQFRGNVLSQHSALLTGRAVGLVRARRRHESLFYPRVTYLPRIGPGEDAREHFGVFGRRFDPDHSDSGPEIGVNGLGERGQFVEPEEVDFRAVVGETIFFVATMA